MIIGVCGLGYTGSGAVIDLLKEFEENHVIDEMEFAIAYAPDCLEDLEFHLVKNPSRYFSSDVAIRRFKNYIKFRNTPRSGYRVLTNNQFATISDNYIESLIQVKWKGKWSFDAVEANWIEKNIKYRILGRLQRLVDIVFKKYIPILPDRTMYLSIKPESFYKLSSNYIKEILTSICGDKKDKIVLDQPFSGDNPEKSFIFFENPFAIIVDRDPRDLYILAKKVVLSNGRFMPSDDVEAFVEYYKVLRSNQNKPNDTKRVLKINFEDLVYEYDSTIKKIKVFADLDNHTFKKRYFDPDISKNNTQLFKKYKEYNEEIRYIEKELAQWLFPFEKYNTIIKHGESF